MLGGNFGEIYLTNKPGNQANLNLKHYYGFSDTQEALWVEEYLLVLTESQI